VPLSDSTCGTSPHPRRRLICARSDTQRHTSPQHAPQFATARATQRHSATLSRLTTRHSTRHTAPQHAPPLQTPQARNGDTASHTAPQHAPPLQTPQARNGDTASHTAPQHAPPLQTPQATQRSVVGFLVDNLLITCGKPLLARGYENGVVDNSTTYPHVIHRLSTGYPQVKTSHDM